MTLLLIFSISMASLLLMPLMLQPLSLGLCIMVLTSLICLTTALFLSSWYSYILFLVFVGGLLVMFAYVAVLAPNSVFSSLKPFIWLLTMFSLSIISTSSLFIKESQTITHPSEISAFLLETSSTGSSIITSSYASILIILGTLLLIALLAVVKICYYQQGPLRTFSQL